MDIPHEVKQKYDALKKTIQACRSVAVAFSGGVDSGVVVKVAFDELGDNAYAVTADSPSLPYYEREEARRYAHSIGIKHVFISTEECNNPDFLKNSPQRCYWCKKELFEKMRHFISTVKVNTMLDGSTAEDCYDFRPGAQAKNEFLVRSPLQECGFSKQEVRMLARYLNLSFWNKAQSACLSSRIPFREKITPQRLKRIESAEALMRKYLRQDILCRVRDHFPIARIEFEQDKISELIQSLPWPKIVNHLKSIGYSYVTVDLQGYIAQGKRQ